MDTSDKGRDGSSKCYGRTSFCSFQLSLGSSLYSQSFTFPSLTRRCSGMRELSGNGALFSSLPFCSSVASKFGNMESGYTCVDEQNWFLMMRRERILSYYLRAQRTYESTLLVYS